MTILHCTDALLPSGWTRDVRVRLAEGRIAAVEAGRAAEAGDIVVGPALPGMPNLHSHAFQRAMAGLAERRGDHEDTFWTWREAMYRCALSVTPEDVEAIAGQLYVEMLEAGFTRVGEFHYLHHDRDGAPYADPAEMAGRIAAAAQASGIRLTLLPSFYAHATFGGAPPAEGQRRFVSSLDGFARLIEASRAHVAALDGATIGIAPHSLRAVTPDELAALLSIAPEGPVHIHAAEQVREVEDCLAALGARPVEWLLEHAGFGRRWCLIHATHMLPLETLRLAASGAVNGVCPITEANLGDGVHDAARYLAAGGLIGIGTDSNVQIGVGAELRQMDYAQRLSHRQRNLLAVDGGSTAVRLYGAALEGGARALAAPEAEVAEGAPADIVTLDPGNPALAGRRGEAILDAAVFSADRAVDRVFVGGRLLVEGGRHHARESILERFRRAVDRLADAA
jgi:formiminoglutamate deiminase